jgi:hypothetical protein
MEYHLIVFYFYDYLIFVMLSFLKYLIFHVLYPQIENELVDYFIQLFYRFLKYKYLINLKVHFPMIKQKYLPNLF